MGQTHFKNTRTTQGSIAQGTVIHTQQNNLGNITLPNERNWAFVDVQNVYKSALETGWKLRWERFIKFLKEQYNVTKAVAFMGYLEEYQGLYKYLRWAGFQLEFQEAWRLPDGKIVGGNIDPDLTSFCMDYKTSYDKAIIVADDRGYCRTVRSLLRQNKLKVVMSPHPIKSTSSIIKQALDRRFIISIHSIRNQIC